MSHSRSAKPLKDVAGSVLTDSGTPVQVDGSGQTYRHTIPIDSSEVARPGLLGRDISRWSIIRRRVSLIIGDLCPCQ